MPVSQIKYDVIVVGGGASGLMAAGRAAERGLRVLLLEKNRKLGEKLRISGGGRCNITNAELDPHILLKAYGKAEQFFYSLFAQFGVKETFSFFEKKGLPLVVQARKRAFPKTEKAEDVVKVMEKYVKDGKGINSYRYGSNGSTQKQRNNFWSINWKRDTSGQRIYFFYWRSVTQRNRFYGRRYYVAPKIGSHGK